MTNIKKRFDCSISSSLDVWGDKWSLLIVRDLIFSMQCTYGDFLKSEEKIATNILATRLQMLESNGIITKLNHPESKAKVLYQLTQKGIDLLPIMVEIHLWADKYSTIPPERNTILKELKNNKEAFIKSYTKLLKKNKLNDLHE
jgi:DNA-binding HxlR family transcriptional regulator